MSVFTVERFKKKVAREWTWLSSLEVVDQSRYKNYYIYIVIFADVPVVLLFVFTRILEKIMIYFENCCFLVIKHSV